MAAVAKTPNVADLRRGIRGQVGARHPPGVHATASTMSTRTAHTIYIQALPARLPLLVTIRHSNIPRSTRSSEHP